MIITKPYLWDFLERLGFKYHHTATAGGYRRSHYKGNRKSPRIYGYLKPYFGRYGLGFILECPSENILQNHKIVYFIKGGF